MTHLTVQRAKSPSSRFSVVITCHNQEAFIAEAVESALTQRHPAHDVIVLDDGSTDSSHQILAKYADDILLIDLKNNRGANAARNFGALQASAAYLVFLDGDDLLLPWALEIYEQLIATRSAEIILTSLAFFDGPASNACVDEPKTVDFCEYPQLIEKDRPYRASASAIVVKRDTFLSAGGWTDQIFPMEDLDLIAKLAYCGRTIQILSPPTAKYRIHASNTVRQVQACMRMLQCVIQRAKRRVYSSPTRPIMQSYAFVGGPAWFWVKRAFQTGFYIEGLHLLYRSWLMILAAGLQRAADKLTPRYRVQSVCLNELNSTPNAPR